MITSNKSIWTTYTATINQQNFDIPEDIAREDPTWIYVRIEDTKGGFHEASGDFRYTVDKINKKIVFADKAKILAGMKVWIRAAPPFTQEANFINGAMLDMEVLENAFDKLTMICQLLDLEVRSKIGVDHTGNSSPFDKITHSSQRNDKLIGFGSTGLLELVPKVDRTTWAEQNILSLTSTGGLSGLLGISEYIRTGLLGLATLDDVRKFMGATVFGWTTLLKLADLPALKTLLDLKHASTDIHTKVTAYSKSETDAKIKADIDALFPGNSYIRQHLASILTRTALEDALFLSPANGYFATDLRTLRTQVGYQGALGIVTETQIDTKVAAHRDPRFPSTSYIAANLGATTTLAALKTALGIVTETQIDTKVAAHRDPRFPSTSYIAANLGATTTLAALKTALGIGAGGGSGSSSSDPRFSTDSYIAEKLGKLAHLPAVRRTMDIYSRKEVDNAIDAVTTGALWSKVHSGVFGTLYRSITVGNRIIATTGNNGMIQYSDDEGKRWKTVQVFTVGSSGYKIVSNDSGHLYAVSRNGQISYSADNGASWTARTSGITNALYSIAFHDKIGIAVGSSGAGVRSTDGGETWSLITPTTTPIYDITYFNNAFIIASNNGIYRSTDDGVTWIKNGSINFHSQFGFNFSHSSSLLFFVGSNSKNYTSADGVNFESIATSHDADQPRSFYAGGYFYIIGNRERILRSSDGKEWEGVKIPHLNHGDAFTISHLKNGRTVIMGRVGAVYINEQQKEDRITREEVENLVPNKIFAFKNQTVGTSNIDSLLFFNGQFCAINKVDPIISNYWASYVSHSGAEWYYHQTSASYNKSLYTGGVFGRYAIFFDEDGTSHYTRNGKRWLRGNSSRIRVGSILRALTYDGDDIITAVGNSGLIAYMSTTPGDNKFFSWRMLTVPSGFTNNLLCVIAANRVIVAAGTSGKILRSTNNTIFTEVTSGTTDDIHAIVYGAGLFVAATNRGNVITSPDGTTWTDRTSGTSSYITKGIRKNGLFIFLAQNGIMITSTDGITWRTADTKTTKTLIDVHYFNGSFYAVGGDASSGVIIRSGDGVHWSHAVESVPKKMSHIASSSNQIVFAGDGGNIYYGSANWPDDSFLGNHLIRPNTELKFLEAIGLGNKLTLSHGNWKFAVSPIQQGGEDTLQLELSRANEPVIETSFGDQKHVIKIGGDLQVAGGVVAVKPYGHIIGPGKWENKSNTGEQHIQYGVWASGNRVVTCGFDGTIYLSTDNGSSFTTPTYASTLTVALRSIVSQAPVDGTNLYAVGDDGTLVWSSDSGSTWGDFYATAGVTKVITQTLYSISYQKPSSAFQVWVAVGANGSIYQFFHNRSGWTSADRSISSLRAILFGVAANGTTWIAVGANGTILRSTNNGTSWTNISNTIVGNLRAVTHVSGNQWVAVGEGGLIVQSLDNGATWTQIPSGKSYTLYAVAYHNNQFIIGGENGKVLAGVIITELLEYSIGADDDIRGVTIVGNSVWVCGASGMIRTNSKIGF